MDRQCQLPYFDNAKLMSHWTFRLGLLDIMPAGWLSGALQGTNQPTKNLTDLRVSALGDRLATRTTLQDQSHVVQARRAVPSVKDYHVAINLLCVVREDQWFLEDLENLPTTFTTERAAQCKEVFWRSDKEAQTDRWIQVRPL